MRGASDVDLALLLSFHSLCNKVYMYNEQQRACFHPEPGMVPWPIIFLAGRYSRKHIFQPPSVPKLHGIRKAMDDFGCKLKWRWCCKDMEELQYPIRVKRLEPAPYSGKLVDPELTAWILSMRNAVVRAATAAVNIHKGRMHKLSNMMPLISFALKLVKEQQLALVPKDKDGGY